MTPFLMLVVGTYAIYLAVTDQFKSVINEVASQPQTGPAPKLFNYLIGGAVVSIPVFILEAQGNNKAAWQYTSLIVIALIVFYYKQFNMTVTQITGIMRG